MAGDFSPAIPCVSVVLRRPSADLRVHAVALPLTQELLLHHLGVLLSLSPVLDKSLDALSEANAPADVLGVSHVPGPLTVVDTKELVNYITKLFYSQQ